MTDQWPGDARCSGRERIATHPALLVLLRNVLDDDAIRSVGCQVVLAPILVGMMTNKFFPNVVKTVLPVTPVVGVLSTCFLVASAVAQASCAWD